MVVLTLQGQDPLNLGMRNIVLSKPFSTETEDDGGNGANGDDRKEGKDK